MLRIHEAIAHRQFNVVFFEPIQTWPVIRGQPFPVHPQLLKTTTQRPAGQIGIVPLACTHARCQKHHAATRKLTTHCSHNRFLGLRLNRLVAVGTIGRAQFDEQKPQKMVNLRDRSHSTLATPSACALLDRHRRWNAQNGIRLGPPGRLHKLPRVCIE